MFYHVINRNVFTYILSFFLANLDFDDTSFSDRNFMSIIDIIKVETVFKSFENL